MNPCQSALVATFTKERKVAIRNANAVADEAEASFSGTNEQLVWVLWKILKGDGSDVRYRASLLSVACADLTYPNCSIDWSIQPKQPSAFGSSAEFACCQTESQGRRSCR